MCISLCLGGIYPLRLLVTVWAGCVYSNLYFTLDTYIIV
jgi:hypothetical protein